MRSGAEGIPPSSELTDMEIFAEGRYFDVFVEYAKHDPDDVAIRITIANRGPQASSLDSSAHLVVPKYLVVGLQA